MKTVSISLPNEINVPFIVPNDWDVELAPDLAHDPKVVVVRCYPPHSKGIFTREAICVGLDLAAQQMKIYPGYTTPKVTISGMSFITKNGIEVSTTAITVR